MQNLTKAQIFSRESYRSQRQQSKIRSYRRATSKRRPIPRCSLVVYRRSTAATDPLYSTLYSALVLAATAAAAARPLLLSAGAAQLRWSRGMMQLLDANLYRRSSGRKEKF